MSHQSDDDLPTVELTQEQYEACERLAQRDDLEVQEIAQVIHRHSTVKE